jgi:methylmalonyl-CoA mutase N-terminal domain/subunit
MAALALTLTDAQLAGLVDAAQRVRSSSTTVRVELAALEALIVDHTRALQLVPHDVPVAGFKPSSATIARARRRQARQDPGAQLIGFD